MQEDVDLQRVEGLALVWRHSNRGFVRHSDSSPVRYGAASVGKLTVVIVLVGVGHLFEDGQDLLVGRSVLDGVAHCDGHGVAW